KVVGLLGIYPDSYGPKGDSTLNLYYLCKKSYGEIILQDEIAEVKWFDFDKIPKLAFKTSFVIEDLMMKYCTIFTGEAGAHFQPIF
ncbi:hypothetical protein L0244_14445, partial [bacterium]|nr:hypothetical protein [bacterium]